MTYRAMEVLAWSLLGIAFAIPLVQIIEAWRDRPVVMWDDRQGRWRAARQIRRERGG